ncbi:hypothetical protein O181_097532 [Austropuccinia psidii MF-1]|uniref:Uncharacterized protein n=1 Tax=Austropuccinia psidii MF-1 TaxID=1389203 RepID=A0A9Q3J8Q3_9BASI|nr:hypothetical protein [Austropuccinia psidii MF-1]
MPKTPGNSTEFNELQTSAPESGSEISDIFSSHQLGIEVESLEHESNPDPPVLPECKWLGKRPNINATKKTNKKCHTFEGAKDSQDQGDDMITVEVDHIETIHDGTSPASPQNIQDLQERETVKHDIMPDPEPKVSSCANFQGIY